MSVIGDNGLSKLLCPLFGAISAGPPGAGNPHAGKYEEAGYPFNASGPYM